MLTSLKCLTKLDLNPVHVSRSNSANPIDNDGLDNSSQINGTGVSYANPSPFISPSPLLFLFFILIPDYSTHSFLIFKTFLTFPNHSAHLFSYLNRFLHITVFVLSFICKTFGLYSVTNTQAKAYLSVFYFSILEVRHCFFSQYRILYPKLSSTMKKSLILTRLPRQYSVP